MAAGALQHGATTNSLPQPYGQSIIGSQGGSAPSCRGGSWRASKERRLFCSVSKDEEELGNAEQMAHHAADKQSTSRNNHFAFIKIRYLNGKRAARTSRVLGSRLSNGY